MKNNWIYKLINALPFTMKAGEELINKNENTQGNKQTINQQVSDERVAKHLLKGELTQSVKELRYRTYKVSDASKDFKYLGDGKAIKKNIKRNSKRIKFSQTCKLLTSSVLEEMERINQIGDEKYNLKISYVYPLVKFKLEEFANQIDVDINKENNDIYTTLHFNSVPDGYNSKSAPFINEIKRLLELYSKVKNETNEEVINEIYSHNEIASTMLALSFTTYKASNDEPDLMSYNFIAPLLYKVEEHNYEITLTFKWESYEVINLKDKFFDKTMEEKYQNKERKNNIFDILGDKDRVVLCEVCGKEISEYESDITQYTFGKHMCKDCLKNCLLSKK